MIGRFLDKLIFGAALLLALQIPQLADHYQQFLAGQYASTEWQVNGYEATAARFNYPNAKAMIEDHLHNESPSVRADAMQKLATFDAFLALQSGMNIFQHGNLLEKSAYMFHPQRYENLEKTLANFKLGIPLTMDGFIFGVIVGYILNLLISSPFVFAAKRIKAKKSGQIKQTFA